MKSKIFGYVALILLLGTHTIGYSKEIHLNIDDVPEFVGIRSGYLASDGQSYFFSSRNSKIFHFNETGKLVNQFCEKGEGPGEIIRVHRMFFDRYKDLLYLPEFYSRSKGKVTIFDLQGTFLGLLKPEISRSQMDKISGIFPLENGNYFIQTEERVGWVPEGKFFLTREETKVQLFSKQGKFIKTIYSGYYNAELSNKKGWGGPRIPYSPLIICKLSSGGEMVITKNNSNIISFYKESGEVQDISLDLKRENLMDSEFNQYKKGLILNYKNHGQTPRMIYLAENMIQVKFKPLFDNLFHTNSSILSHQIVGKDKDGYPTLSEIRIFNNKGHFQKTVKINGYLLNISGEHLIIKSYDDEGAELIRIVPATEILSG